MPSPESDAVSAQAPSRAEPLVAFVHIEKTGGSTVGSVLLRAYAKRSVRNSGNVFSSPEKTLAKVRRLAELPSGLRAVTGVTPFSVLRSHLPAETRYVTLLRDPVDRTLSHYHWFMAAEPQTLRLPTRSGPRRLPLPPAGMPLAKLLADGVYVLDNLQTRMLCDLESPFGELGAETLEQAKRNLATFAFVGLTERMDESIVLLERVLGLGLVPYTSEKVNRDRPRAGDLSPAEREAIEEHNQLDLQLYEFARRLFETSVSEGGNGVAEQVAELQRISIGPGDATPATPGRVKGSKRAKVAKQGGSRERIPERIATSAARSPRPGAKPPGSAPRKRRRIRPSAPRSGPLTVFIHIPKAAGTTFTNVLRANYPAGGVRGIGNVFKGGGGIDQGPLARLEETGAALISDIYVLGGHVPFGIRDLLPEDTRYITFLRDPVERLLSHYYFLLSLQRRSADPDALPQLSPETTLAEVIADGRYVYDNLQTRMLCGDPEPFGEVTAGMLERAKENLRDAFVAFGLTERFDESLVLIGRELGLRSLLYQRQRVNESRPRADEVAADVAELAARFDSFDIELYGWAVKLFEQNVTGQDPDFALTVAALRTALGSPSSPDDGAALDAAQLTALLVEDRAALLDRELQLARLGAELDATRRELDEARSAVERSEATIASLEERVQRVLEKLALAKGRSDDLLG